MRHTICFKNRHRHTRKRNGCHMNWQRRKFVANFSSINIVRFFFFSDLFPLDFLAFFSLIPFFFEMKNKEIKINENGFSSRCLELKRITLLFLLKEQKQNLYNQFIYNLDSFANSPYSGLESVYLYMRYYILNISHNNKLI